MKDKTSKSEQEIELALFNCYQLVPYSPFMPVMDLSYAFAEIKRLVKQWTLQKRSNQHLKKQYHENI